MNIPNQTILILALILIGGTIFVIQSARAPSLAPENTPLLTQNKSELYTSAPDLQGIAGYLNTHEGFTLSEVKGKVILIDFWTYSCINCIRTQPYLNAWHEKYTDKGLVIVGVHSPEFDFEKKIENVQAAVEKESIKYPIVLDNDFQTWRAYQNQYWPRKYLIDADGFIRYDHVGEGSYAETEAQIQALLLERDEKLSLEENVSPHVEQNTPSTNFSQIRTPEIYLGYEFARAPLANPEGFQPEESVVYELPESLPPNVAGLEGEWLNRGEYMELVSEYGGVALMYTAKNVNIVAANPAEVSIIVDDLPPQMLSTNEEKLYEVVRGEDYGTHTLVLDIYGKGFRLYTFTFG